MELLQQGDLDKVTVDVDKSDKLIRLLDTVVIKLEGGTEEDLKVLDEPPPSENTNNEKQGGNRGYKYHTMCPVITYYFKYTWYFVDR